MDNSNNELCRLCRSVVDDGNFQMIKDTIKEDINILFLNVNLDEKVRHLICTVCLRKVKAALDFKSKCLAIEESILPYVNEELSLPIDLKEVYARKKGNEQLIHMPIDQEICRLCMQLVCDEFTAFCNVDVKIIIRYIPELNFYSTKDPVICKPCLESLNIHSSFIRDCLDVDERFDSILDNKEVLDAPVCDFRIKTEEIEIKSEDDQNEIGKLIETKDCEIGENGEDRNKTAPETSRREIKTEGYLKEHIITHKSTKVRYECNFCDYETNHNSTIKQHMLKHKSLSEVELHECNLCDFKTKYKNSLKMHMSLHKHPSQIQWYECNMCNYKTKREPSLEKHMLTHKSPSEIRWHECSLCTYKAKLKGALTVHMLIHKSPSEVEWYKCDFCDHKTKQKGKLKLHMLQHQPPSESMWFQCISCNFKSKYKRHMDIHMLNHKHPSEIEWFQCNLCSYKGKYKGLLGMHMQVHKPPSEVTWYNCDSCDFKAKRKSGLTRHKLVHESPSEIKWFQCNLCSVKSKYKHKIKIHMLIHKPPSEIEWHKCNLCSYKGKQKNDLKRHMLKHRSEDVSDNGRN